MLKKYSYLILVLSTFYSHGEELKSHISKFGTPFFCTDAPFFLGDQRGFPLGVQLYVPSDDNFYAVDVGIAASSRKNGFGLVIQNYINGLNNSNRFIGAYSQRFPLASFGSVASINRGIAANPFLTLGTGCSFYLKKNMKLFLMLDNIIGSDSSYYYSPPQTTLGLTGPIKSKIDDLAFEFSTSAKSKPFVNIDKQSFDSTEFTYEIKGLVQGNVIANPPLKTILGFLSNNDKNNQFTNNLIFGLGSHIHFQNISCEVNSKIQINLDSKKGDFQGTFIYNPQVSIDTIRPTTLIQTVCDTLTGTMKITLVCKDDGKNEGVKFWTLAISNVPSSSVPPLKTYSGSSITPSMIVWNFHDSQGVLLEQSTVYLRLSAVDFSNNQGVSEWFVARQCK